MAKKKSFTKADAQRIQRAETVKTGGTTRKGSFAAKVQSKVAKKSSNN